MLTFWNGTDYGYIWVLRWDDSANATEFQDALNRFLDERATPAHQGWVSESAEFRFNRVSPDTVVLIAGEKGFVRTANVTGTGESVSIGIG